MARDRVQVGIVGDFDPQNRTHRYTNDALEHVGLRFEWIGTDAVGDPDERLAAYDGIRIVELPDHPFFVATLFLPQARSTVASPHPLLVAYAAAVAARASLLRV